ELGGVELALDRLGAVGRRPDMRLEYPAADPVLGREPRGRRIIATVRQPSGEVRLTVHVQVERTARETRVICGKVFKHFGHSDVGVVRTYSPDPTRNSVALRYRAAPGRDWLVDMSDAMTRAAIVTGGTGGVGAATVALLRSKGY